jgi:hypothetical protein
MEQNRRERAASGHRRSKTHEELFGPDINDKPLPEKVWKKIDFRNKVIQARRTSSVQLNFGDARVPSVSTAKLEDDQFDENAEMQRLIDDFQVEERGHVSLISSPTKKDYKGHPSLPAPGISLTRSERRRRPAYATPVGEWRAQAHQRELAAELNAEGRYSSSDTLAEGPENDKRVILEMPQPLPSNPRTSARPIVFSPIPLGREPTRAHPTVVQRFYRETAQNTQKELHKRTESEEVWNLTEQYWKYVERKIHIEDGRVVPESPESCR